ncbi:hypothetical protein RI367_006296 [Sorochytrium milnesiophthora]
MSASASLGRDVYRKWNSAVPDEVTNSVAPALTTFSLGLISLPQSIRGTPGFPPFLQLAGFTSLFALSAYCVNKDKHVGPSIATAWAATYMSVNGYRAFKSRNMAASLVVLSAAFQVLAYGKRPLQEMLGLTEEGNLLPVSSSKQK